MINITVQQRQINITALQPKPVTITVGAKPVNITVPNRNVTYITASGFHNTYNYTLSQIDIDNKFIIISELSTLSDKTKAIIVIENVGIVLEYDVDYVIDNDNKIIWEETELEAKLQVGDKLKIYY